MTTKPNDHPELNSAVTGPETAPTSGERSGGFALNYLLSRQKVHWLMRKCYQWTKYVESGVLALGDVSPDHFVPVTRGTAVKLLPSTTSGTLTGITGARTGVVSGDKCEADSAAHVFSANSDTYFDLQRDGGWNIQVVAAMAAAPALAADTIRSHYVRTDGVELTDVVDLGDDDYEDRSVVDAGLEVLERIVLGKSKVSNQTLANEPRIEHHTATLIQAAWTLISRMKSVVSNLAVYYIPTITGSEYWFVFNAERDPSTTQWSRGSFLEPSYLLRYSPLGVYLYYHASADASPWTHGLGVTAQWELILKIGPSIADPANVRMDNGDRLRALYMQTENITVTHNPIGVPIKNTLYSYLVPKAAGVFTTDGSSGFTVEQYVGVANLSFSSTEVVITLQNAMSSNEYPVLYSAENPHITPHSLNKTTTQITVQTQTTPGFPIDMANTSGVTVVFWVFGEQA